MTSVEQFLKDHEEHFNLDEKKKKIEEFIKIQMDKKRKVALVTSGGTSVPLEKNTVRSITNFSKGARGAHSTEEFVKNGYAVLYVHSVTAKMPFSIPITPRDLDVKDGKLVFKRNSSEIKENVLMYQKIMDENMLCEVSFETIQEYLLLLKILGVALRPLKKNALILAAAAVSDFYLPISKMNEHKIQSRNYDSLELKLEQTPKMLKPLKDEWSPDAYLVSFKLETDANILDSKIQSALKNYKMHLVIGNLLQNYQDKVYVVDENSKLEIERKENEKNLEPKLISEVVKRHEKYCKE